MTETSFPIVGSDFTSDEWSQALTGLGNGVLDDWGNPYAITLNTNDTATIAVSTVTGVAHAVVAGFGHRLTAAVTLSIPAVASTTTYNIGLLYDPAKTTTPVLLTVVSGAVTLTTGQVWLPLHVIVRQPSQALTSAVLTTPMLKMQPRASVGSEAALLAQNPQTYLQGTTVYCKDTTNKYRADLVGSTPTWVGDQVTGAFTPASGAAGYAAGPVAPTLYRNGGRVYLEGNVISAGGVTFVAGTTYTVGSIPADFGPTVNAAFSCTSNATAVAQVVVTPAGTVTMTLNVGFTGALNLWLNNCNWKAKKVA